MPRTDEATAWTPDDHLLACARSYKVNALSLSAEDRSWVVAGLIVDGHTSDAIAERLHCSVRLIKQIRTHPMTAVCRYALSLVEITNKVEAAADIEIRAANRSVTLAQNELLRIKDQRDQLIKAEAKRRAVIGSR